MVFIWYGGFQPHPVSSRIPYEQVVQQITRTEPISPLSPNHSQNAILRYLEKVSDQQSQRRPVLTVSQLMSQPVITVGSKTSLREAWRLMSKYRIRHLPVWDEGKGLVGIFSDRNLTKALSADMDGHPLEQLGDQMIGNWMTGRVLTAHQDTPIREAAGLLVKGRVNSLPIVNDEHELVGILTSSNILAGVVNHAPLDLWT